MAKTTEKNHRTHDELTAELDMLRNRLVELEELEVSRITDEQERFDSLQVLDEYARQLEESRDKLARLLRAGVAVQGAKTTQETLQKVVDAVGEAGWGSVSVNLLNNFEITEAAYFGVHTEDIKYLETHRRSAEERARAFGQEFERFRLSRSYFVPAERLSEVIPSQFIVPGRREIHPGDEWDPMDLAYVPLYGSNGKVIGSINCDDPVDGRRPTAETFSYLELFADLAARKVETHHLLQQRTQIEQVVRENEEKYRTLFNHSADSFFVVDELIRDCNSKACELLGCESEDIVGHSITEFSPKLQPDSKRSDRAIADYVRKAMRGEPQHFDWVLTRADGTPVFCEVSFAAIEVGHNKMVLGIARDVTERKRNIEDKDTISIVSQLFLSSNRLDLIYSQLPKILVNRFQVPLVAIELMDRERREMVFEGLEGMELHGHDLLRVPMDQTISGTVVQTGQPVFELNALRRPDYQNATLRSLGIQSFLSVPLVANDMVIGALSVADTASRPELQSRLVTLQVIGNYLAQAIDRRRAEEEASELRSFYERMLNDLPAQVAVIETNGDYRYVNRASVRDAELRKWIIGKNDFEFCNRRRMDISIAEKRSEFIRQVVASKAPCHYEETIASRSGGPRRFVRVLSPALNSQGSVDHIIGYGLDITDEDDYRHHRALFASVAGTKEDLVMTADMSGSVLVANPAARDLAQKLRLNSLNDLLPKTHAQIAESCLASDSKETSVHHRVSGRTLRFTYHANGTKDHVQIFGMDVTDAEAQVSHMQRIVAVMESSPIPTIIASLEGGISFLNTAALDMFKIVSAADADSKSLADLLICRGFNTTDAFISKLIAEKHWQGEVYSMDRKVTSLCGAQCTAFAVIQPETQLPVAVALILSTSLAHLNDGKMEWNLDFARRYPEPVIVCDRNGKIAFSNDSANLRVDETQAADLESLLPTEHSAMTGNCFASCEPRTAADVRVGNYIFSWTYFPNPGTESVFLVMRDVTQIRLLESELEHAQKMEAVGRLASGVAHDFNNLLTGIMGNLDLAQGSDENANKSVYIREAAAAADRAASLVRQLLSFSRKSTSVTRNVSLNSVCGSVVNMLTRTLNRRVELLFEPGADLWSVLGDPNRLEQVIMNLCVNAADAVVEKFERSDSTWEGNALRITISTANVLMPDPKDSKESLADSRFVRVTVSDNGSGMNAETQRRLFEPFYTTKGIGKGTGLGLSTVRDIVTELNGHVEFKSRPGEGTTFDIFFPGLDAEESELAVPNIFKKVVGGGETILLVDDEEVIRRLGEDVLESFGYKVLLATNGYEAVEVFKANKDNIELVVLDVCLPGLSGDEVLPLLLEVNPDLKVILSSGVPEYKIGHSNINLGSVAFVNKPYRPSDLAIAVRDVLDHKAVD